jgi:aspartyl-tRNA synthetase
MVSGFEKYYQIARCFRDEDSRADRQPEFTQLDIEMSFVEEDDILNLLEEMFTTLVKQVKPELRVITPFPRLTYAEVMNRYCTDKPDIRFGLEIRDITDIAAQSGFAVFKSAIEAGGRIKGICLPGCAGYTRRQVDELTDLARSYGAKGLVPFAFSQDFSGTITERAAEHVNRLLPKFLAEQMACVCVVRCESVTTTLLRKKNVTDIGVNDIAAGDGSRLD